MAQSIAYNSREKPFTSAEYIESLRDNRQIWIYGDRVDDVTTHPAFRNTIRMTARLYDALHDERKPKICTPTDSGGYTHRFFRPSRDREDLLAARDAIAEWARITYGWTGRSPDYMASFIATLGADPDYFAPYDDNARQWYTKLEAEVAFVNHAFVNPPVDRNKSLDEVRDVYMHVEEETDGGLIISGAKVVATAAPITNYNIVANNSNPQPIKSKDFAFICIVPTSAEGVKFLCRPSYEMMSSVVGSPFDYPLSSRLDENDSILIFDKVFVPWENVLAYGDVEKVNNFFPGSGFLQRYMLHGCTRLAVKLDFMVGLLLKGVEATGTNEFRGVQVLAGELISSRNLLWGLADAMAGSPTPWNKHYVLPNLEYGLAYQVLASQVYPRIKEIMENVLASALIYLPSHARDFKNPELRPYIDRFVRGSNGFSGVERVKLMKLIWDAIGTEFGSRHELYERNYFGSHESIRLEALKTADRLGRSEYCKAFVDSCMADYDLDGWTCSDLINA
jgi:4-hydroxyphenylacetate 3-monooxygenase